MIRPTKKDIGRRVLYVPTVDGRPESGVLSSFNDLYAFVRYGGERHTKATNFKDLVWEFPDRSP